MANRDDIERRPTGEDEALPGEPEAASLDGIGDISASEPAVTAPGETDAVDSEIAVTTDEELASDGGDIEIDSDEEQSGADDADGVEPPAVGRLSKVRGLGQFKIDGDRLRSVWRSHSLGRISVVAILVYVLAVGSAYLFMLQPISERLHVTKEQKSILHDYTVIQQADAAIGTFKDGLMTGDQRLTVMSEVKLMAEGAGVKIVGDPDLLLRRGGSGHIVEYPIRLRVRGAYHEVGEFLSLLESSPRFPIVEEVEIRSEVESRSSESEATVLLALPAWEG